MKSWGGTRTGAGRPVVRSAEKRVSVTMSVAPETEKKIKELRKKGIKIGKIVDDMIERMEL